MDANSGEIIAHKLTDQDTDDSSQVELLLSQIDQFTADGAYDGKPTYQTILQHSAIANVVIPPRSTAVESGSAGPPGQRGKHTATIAKDGRMKWQAATGYGKRALIETAMGRYKGLIGRRLRARSVRSSAGGDCHRLHHPQPYAGMWTPGLCPLPGQAGIVDHLKS